MQKFNLQQILSAMEKKPLNKAVFCTSGYLKSQVMFLKAGNSIPPCKMENDVLFYILSGKGSIVIDADKQQIATGDCVVVPFQANSRSINAETDMEILAVQGLKQGL
jgi:mannose-6-phosphate isomerase-like protein (cupin superfamily)